MIECTHPPFKEIKQSSDNFGWYNSTVNDGKSTEFTICGNCGKITNKIIILDNQ